MKDLDRLLREAARASIDDDGFTARVMGALPARREPRRIPWLRPVLVMGSATVGSALAVALSPQAGALLDGFRDLFTRGTVSAPAIAALALAGALLVSGLVLAADEN